MYSSGLRAAPRGDRGAEDDQDIVIGAAMRILRQENLVETLAGVGVYVADPLPPGPRMS